MTKVYDLEHHSYNKEYIEYLSTRKEYPTFDKNTGVLTYHKGAFLPFYTVYPLDGRYKMIDIITDIDSVRLEQMDNAGIDASVLSTGASIESLPKEEAVKYSRITNDAIAAACRKHPDRFAGTICLPMPYVEESVKELERAVKELGLKYLHTHSNYGNEYLCDDKFIPIIAKCEELDVPIYIHPHNPTAGYLTEYGMMFSSAGFGFAVDTMRTSLKFILNGRLDQFPKLKLILGHMAEFYPYIIERLDNRFFCIPDPDVKCKHNFTYYFNNKNIFMTTSGITDPDVVMFVIKKFGIDNIMFGTDFPFEDFGAAVKFIRSLPISDEDKDKIFYRNAEKYILKNQF